MAIAPVLGFGLLLFCPETPVWYMQVGRQSDSKDALIKLRGESNMDIVETEFNRISLNLKAQQKEQGTDFLSIFMLLLVVSLIQPDELNCGWSMMSKVKKLERP